MTVLASYVPTKLGDLVLDRAIDQARQRQTDLIIFNIARGDVPLESQRLTQEQRIAVTQRLERAGVRYEIQSPVRLQDTVEAILDAAVDADADLLVIGLRHRSPVGKFLLGSTAQHLLLRSPCDVLSVKGDYN